MALSRFSAAAVAILAVVLFTVACEATTRVTILNDLRLETTIKVHCRSKEQDLGFHDLSLGSSYDFSFNTNPSTTLFVCSLQWDGELHLIDAYKIDYGCQDQGCNWKIRDEGSCLSVGTQPMRCTLWK